MANLQMLLKCALILTIATVFSNSQYILPKKFWFNDTNVPNPFPIHYDVQLTLLDIDNMSNNYFNISGNISITFKIIKPTMYFQINLAPSVNIHANSLIMVNGPNDRFNFTTKHTYYTNELSSYQKYSFTRNLQPGTYIMTLEYNDVIHDNEKGFHRISYQMRNSYNNSQLLIATNSQPNGIHQIFPCFELPESRATFNISIKMHSKYDILTNMGTEHDHYLYPDGLQMKRFVTTPRIPVYQVAFFIYNFKHIKNIKSTTEDKIYSRNSEMHINYTKEVIEIVTSNLQTKWQDIKRKWNPIINYALIPGFYFDSADAWRLVFFREAKAIYDDEKDTFGHKIAVTSFLAQKITRQWLGNIISHSNWSSLWFNDGIAIYFGIDAANKTFPEMQMWNLFVVQDIHDSLSMDVNSFMKSLYAEINSFEIDTNFGFVRYLKAPAIMRMIYYMMSTQKDDLFENTVKQYLMNTYYKIPTIDDFWSNIDNQIEKQYFSQLKNKTLKTIMNTWLENNYPIIHVRTFLEDNKDVLVKVKQVNSDRYNWHRWWIFITWFTDHLLNYTHRITSSLSKWLSPNDDLKTLTTLDSVNGWIILNTLRCGYYRVFYNVANWRRIGWFLMSNTKSIHVLNRAQLIDDAFYFVLTNKLDSNVFLELTLFLAQDTDYVAWYPMFKALERISPIFALYSKRIANLKVHLLSLLVPLLRQIGYDAKSNENELTQSLREEAAKWACLLDDIECKNIANQKLNWHLENRETNKLLPGWKKWTYCKGLVNESNLVWHSAAHTLDDERDDNFLEYIMCSDDYYVAILSFQVLKDNTVIKNAQPRHDVIHYMLFLAKYANNTVIIDEILDEILEEKKPRGVTEITGLTVVINNIYTTAGLDKVDEYANDKRETLSSMIRSKIAMRKKHLKKIENLSLIITPSERDIK